MEKSKSEKKEYGRIKLVRSAKECAFIAVFVALVIVAQVALSFVPGVEIVTVLFVSYSFAFGVRRATVSALAFAFLRQIAFGFYPTVLILYIVYFPLLAVCFGLLGKKIKKPLKFLALIVAVACVCTACFTLIDNIITPLWCGYGEKSARLYFTASLTFMLPQIVCTALSVTCLFIPLFKIFDKLKSHLESPLGLDKKPE